MPDQPKPFYLTTPIYYVNARPHIGHAYTTIVGDVLARRHRLLAAPNGDQQVYFLTGTDEHGQKIERSAAAAGIPPQQFTDQVSKTFSDLFARMGITNNAFIRTTSPQHIRGAQHLFAELYKNGFIYLDSYTGQYCVSDETFVDVPVGSPCPDCGRTTETVTEENFFFRLSAFQLPLLDLIESGQLAITPDSARNEVLSFIRGNVSAVTEGEGGFSPLSNHDEKGALAPGLLSSAAGTPYVPGALRDLSISRSSFTWGIPVPEDIQQAAGATQNHVIYVWLDALANYMTALGYGSEDDSLFQKFWPADLHLVGKEITRFHCVYWPAFLMAAGIATPKAITANGWLLFDNAKMSKSKGNVVRTETILEGFGSLCPAPLSIEDTNRRGTASAVPEASLTGGSSGLQPTESTPPEKGALAPGFRTPTRAERDLFATDVLRYHLLREIPFGQDGSFGFEAMITRYNADLANGYGNLVSRTLSMISKYFDGAIPHPNPDATGIAYTRDQRDNLIPMEGPAFDDRYRHLAAPMVAEISKHADTDFSAYLQDVTSFVSAVDGFITSSAPWKLAAKDDAQSKFMLRTVLYSSAELIRIITALLYPILPYTTAKVWAQLGLNPSELTTYNSQRTTLSWGGLQPGTKLGPLSPIFPRADKGLAQTMADLEEPKTPNPEPQTESQNPQPPSTADPAAGPRTASLTDPITTLPVGGSTAHTTGPDGTPSHTVIAGSGIFAAPPLPLTTDNLELTTPQITIDDFARIELRVAEIKVAERIPKADKLLRLEVDLGPHGSRQILSGIAEFYTPEELIGRRIVVITNLAPRKMRGLESHGMLLAASDGDNGKPHLATCGPEIALGSRLK